MADSSYSFWDRSAIFFSTAMAFVVALAWKDAVHSMFESWFPVPEVGTNQGGRTAWQRLISKRTTALFVYALLITAAAIGILELVPKANRHPKKAEEEGDRGASGETQKSSDGNKTARADAGPAAAQDPDPGIRTFP